MARRHVPLALIAAGSAALLLSGCIPGIPGLNDDAEGTGSITIQPLFTRGDSGGVGEETITRSSTDDGEFRLDFSEDEVGGLGESSRAASWNAAIISTLLTGQPLSGRFAFEIQGAIDGPSAGALKTLALIALQRGDEIADDATMTGTINATGTIGPVGGIPEKIQGAADSDIAKVLVPLGQRNTPNLAGEQVDVVRLGEDVGVEVIEVGDIYEAYEQLTGEPLEAPTGGGEPRLDNRSYDKVDAQVTAAIGRYQAAAARYQASPAELRATVDAAGVPAQAAEAATRAEDLRRQGLVAGAYSEALNAAALAETAAASAEFLAPVLTQGVAGIDAVIDRALNPGPAQSAFQSFLDQLSTYEPESVSDVEALVNAYALTFDAYTLLDFSVAQIDALGADIAAAQVTPDSLFNQLALSVIYLELAQSQIESARSLFEVGRDNPSEAVAEGIDLFQVGDFFRRGADANYAAFTTSGVVPQLAEANGLSTDVVINYLSQYDIAVALATHQQAVLPSLEAYIGEDEPNAAYAAMGYGVNNYVRNQLLVEKYYNNAVLDENYQIVGLSFEGALNNAIDLSRQQLATDIESLTARGVSPVITVANYQAAGLTAAGTPLDRFETLGGYSGGFVTARLLTYLGGWEDSDD